jgi:hypothetical protein
VLDLPGARRFEITGLRPEESLSLLERLVGLARVAGERAAAGRLAAACSHQPLAVRTAAARLIARPGWSIAAMLSQLLEELAQPMVVHADCLTVEAPFESAYRRLTPGRALAFRQAAMGDGLDVSVTDFAVLLDVPEHKALALLDSLADVHLLEACDSGRYRFDALVKLYARRKALADREPLIVARGARGRDIVGHPKNGSRPGVPRDGCGRLVRQRPLPCAAEPGGH